MMSAPASANGFTLPPYLGDWANQQPSYQPEGPSHHNGQICASCGLVSSHWRQEQNGRIICEVRAIGLR